MFGFKTNKLLRQRNKLLTEALKRAIPSLQTANSLDPPKDNRVASMHYRALVLARALTDKL